MKKETPKCIQNLKSLIKNVDEIRGKKQELEDEEKNLVKEIGELAESQGSIKDVAQKTILRREELKLVRSRKERIEQLENQKLEEMNDLNTIATIETSRIFTAMVNHFKDALYDKISVLFRTRDQYDTVFIHFEGLHDFRYLESYLVPEFRGGEERAANILRVWDAYEKSGYKGILALKEINLGEFQTLMAA